jgi:hypothetical protein
VRQLHLGIRIAGRAEEHQGEAARLHVDATLLHQAELVAVEVERLLEIGHAHHRVQVSKAHGGSSRVIW